MKKTSYSKGDIVKILIQNDNKSSFLITKFNYMITIKKAIVDELKLKGYSNVILKIGKFYQETKPKNLFCNNSIDLLFFLPASSTKGSKLYAEKIIINNEHFIRIASIHLRGSSKQILLKRFIKPEIFGKLLGQIQAEGTKTNYDLIEFCNKNLLELKDFIYFLSKLGISEDKVKIKLDYHICFEDKLNKITREFKNFLGLDINYFSSSTRKAKGYGFKIIVRSTVISELILNSLNIMRKYLEEVNWNTNLTSFAEGYLSKILSGDGTFEITSKNRKKLQSRIKIYDGNREYLYHYAKILKIFGFSPHVKEKQIFVRAMCNLELAKKLLRIGAFDNNKNKEKINIFIQNNKDASRTK